MLPTSVLLVFFLSSVVDVYSQSANTPVANTPVLKSSTSNVCSDSQTVSDWILEAPSRLKTNEKSANKTVESATGGHGEDGSKHRRRIVLMKFRGKRRLRTRPSKTAPETEYRLDLVNKFTNNAEVLFVAHYPNRSECGMGTFSSYEESSLTRDQNVKQKDECFWSIESSLSVKGKKQFKYITPKCGCFNFSYYIAYKPGDETVIDRPVPASTDPFKRLTRTYCIAEGFKSLKSKNKKRKHRRGKKTKKHRKSGKDGKIEEVLARSRKDARSQPGKAPRLPYSEYSPYRRSEYSPYRENQMFLNKVDEPSRSDINNLNEHEESQNTIKHYEYYSSGGFTENSEDNDYDDDEEGREEIDNNVIPEEGIEGPLVEAEVEIGLSEGENVQMSNEVEGKDEVAEEFYVDESEKNVDVERESSDEKIEMDVNESGEKESDDDSIGEDDDDNHEHAESSESENRIDKNESSEESKENENESNENNEEEFKSQSGENENNKNDKEINEKNEINDNTSDEDEREVGIHEQKHDTDDSCESDESDENSAEDESEKESVGMLNVLSEPYQGETEPTRENRNDEESQESSEEEREPQMISRVPENERLSRKEHRRRKHFGLMDRNRRRRLQRRRRRKHGNNKETFKAVRICCNQGTYRKKLILHNKLENISDFAETCENVPHSLTFRIARIYKVIEEICIFKYKECCNHWSILPNKPRLDRFRNLRILH